MVVTCSSCAAPVAVAVLDGLSAQRHPGARAQVLGRHLNRSTCACGVDTTVARDVLYTDLERGQWIQVLPEPARLAYPTLERDVAGAFAAAFDPARFPPAVVALAAGVRPRVAFGYEELREKLVAADAGLDDAIVEVLKLEILVVQPQLLRQGVELLVLDAADAERLRFVTYVFPPGEVGVASGEVVMARAAYDALAADRDALRGTYPGLFEAPYVNALRYRFAAP